MLDCDAEQEGAGQQNQGDVTRPAEEAAHFVLIQAQVFGRFQILFNAPARADGLHDGGQGSGERGKDLVKGPDGRIVKATTDEQEVASVHGPGLHGVVQRFVQKWAISC